MHEEPPAVTSAWDPIRESTNDLLERREELTALVAQEIRTAMPQYAELPFESVVAPLIESIAVATIALRDRRLLAPDELATLRAIGEQRALQGIDVEGPLHAMRIAVARLWALQSDGARRHGADPATLLAAHEHLWLLTDAIAGELSAGHHATELALARRAYQHRVDLVRALLLGRRTLAEAADQVVSLGIDPDAAYVVCRGRADEHTTVAELEAALTAVPDATRPAVVVPLEDDVVGLLPAAPIGPLPGFVGLSPPLPLAEAASGFRLATRALATALRFGRRGGQTIASLGVHVAISADHDLGEALEARYVAPLRSGRHHDRELERTVAAYLDNDLRLEATARQLQVHPNTLRQRLRRYGELTGADLRSLPDQFAVWWALQRAAPREET